MVLETPSQLLSPLRLRRPAHNPLIPKATRQIRAQPRHELPHSRLILPVLGILPGGDLLGQPRRALEECEVGHGSDERPVEVGVRDVAGPLVQHDPDGLLGGEVGVPAPGPEARGVEAAVEVLAVVFWGDLPGFLVGLFGALEVWAEVSVRVVCERGNGCGERAGFLV